MIFPSQLFIYYKVVQKESNTLKNILVRKLDIHDYVVKTVLKNKYQYHCICSTCVIHCTGRTSIFGLILPRPIFLHTTFHDWNGFYHVYLSLSLWESSVTTSTLLIYSCQRLVVCCLGSGHPLFKYLFCIWSIYVYVYIFLLFRYIVCHNYRYYYIILK